MEPALAPSPGPALRVAVSQSEPSLGANKSGSGLGVEPTGEGCGHESSEVAFTDSRK